MASQKPIEQLTFQERVVPNLGTFLAITALLPAIALVSEPFDVRVGLFIGLFLVTLVWALMIKLAPKTKVTDTKLYSGRAQIDRKFISDVQVVGKDQIFFERGPGLNPAAYKVFQGTVHTAVKVLINDPEDPTPYWLVSTRHPDKLRAAVLNTD